MFSVQAVWGATNTAVGTLTIAGGNAGQSGEFVDLTSGVLTFTSIAGLGFLSMAACPWAELRFTVSAATAAASIALNAFLVKKN